jgi:hypothetical protein
MTGDEIALPPATVVVRHRQSGGSTVALVLVSLGLAPFVQAMVGAFGATLADALHTGTRGAGRRLSGPPRRQRAGARHASAS